MRSIHGQAEPVSRSCLPDQSELPSSPYIPLSRVSIKELKQATLWSTCSTIILPYSTNEIIDFWRCRCLCRRQILKSLINYQQHDGHLQWASRVVYKSRQPAKFAGFSARFRRLLSLLHKSKYVEEMDPQPSTFHKTPATSFRACSFLFFHLVAQTSVSPP